MTGPAGTVTVHHGSTTVHIPRSVFRGDDAEIVAEEAERFRSVIMERYPWLSSNAVDVILNNGQREMRSVLDEETHGLAASRVLAAAGNTDGAIRHLKSWAEREPEDPDIWYALARLYFGKGDAESGHKAMNRGRSLI